MSGKSRKHNNGLGGLFAYEDRKRKLAEFATPLDTHNATIDWEGFRPILAHHVPRKDRSRGGRPPFDHVLMFKILISQASHREMKKEVAGG
jgi:IS5 family transposase